MKQQAPRNKFSKDDPKCPECNASIPLEGIRQHILTCGRYIPTYLTNARRLMEQIPPSQIDFLISQMDIIKEELISKVEEDRDKKQYRDMIRNGHNMRNSQQDRRREQQKLRLKEIERRQIKKEELAPKGSSKQDERPKVDGTLKLEDLLGSNDPFKEPEANGLTIQCVDPHCTSPVKYDDIERYTYLQDCLHPICKYCFRNYVRNKYVKSGGDLKCPDKKCKSKIPHFQMKDIVDPQVLSKLQNQLNSKAFDLIECQKCHEQYQFQKGKPSDAPKKTIEGNPINPSMAQHYAENRFQCPKCKQQQCKTCKENPYHLGFNCQNFKEHKLKKKCRYCRNVLPKNYMSESGIKAFDDICSSKECNLQMKESCSKIHPCGHSCGGFIREKTCLPCLKEKCALKSQDKLHGENQNSYCSLCYIQSLNQAPCIQSKCGHVFHLKCLKKRIQLKWGSPRITFRFCECPICNKWMEVPGECSLSKDLAKFKICEQKIKDKALKRLKHENQDKSERITDPKSAYYKDEVKYATTIYAYFECFECGEPYFGGRKSCAQAMNDAKDGEKFDPKELICPSCCPVQVSDCKKHGKEFISFKCRFCCSVAQWFCWGNTHFCDQCHKNQISGKYISRLAKDKLPKCEGKGKCPVGGQHGGNGAEMCLGCGICRGDRLDAVNDF